MTFVRVPLLAIASFRCAANFGRCRGIADSGKPITRRIYGFTAYSIVGILGLQCANAFGGATSGLKLRNAKLVPVICPTCQNVFAGKSSRAGDPLFLCMGLFSIFLLGAASALRPGLYSTGTPFDPRVITLEFAGRPLR
jgi:hypothetical protein